MAPFNQRQIGYIQAIAGRQQHVTLKCGATDFQRSSDDGIGAAFVPQALRKALALDGSVTSTDDDRKSLHLHTLQLTDAPIAFDARSVHNNDKLEADDFSGLYSAGVGLGPSQTLDVFHAPLKGTHIISNVSADSATQSAAGELVANPETISSNYRATEDGFLNSTDVKVRFTLATNPDATTTANNPMGQNHYEFRWIVWRHKKPGVSYKAAITDNDAVNMDVIRNGASFRHPGYDFFMGQTGRKRGMLGYTLNPSLDKDKITTDVDGERYSGKRWNGSAFIDGSLDDLYPADPDSGHGEELLTVDDLLTMRINRDDYVIMKDVRFFLGKEHGKSHFEDHLHWDWNDPISTPLDDVLSSATLNDKSYRWNMTLIGTAGGKEPVVLNTHCRWTTKMESG